MEFEPAFPTALHREAANVVKSYFSPISAVDTVLIVNSCARGQAVAESDLDLAILVKPLTTAAEIKKLEAAWFTYLKTEPTILRYTQSGPFAHLHVDIVDGKYIPAVIETGEPIDYFEIEIGNQVCYSVPMEKAGSYFKELQNKWLPYYNDELRLQRLEMTRKACEYDLEHIAVFMKRELYFQSFEILYKAFQEYLQALFIAGKMYPIAYNKWIKEQVVNWLGEPALYSKLSRVISVSNIESNEIYDKARMLRTLLNNVKSQ
jgi:predicted nucleotidyltransferase